MKHKYLLSFTALFLLTVSGYGQVKLLTLDDALRIAEENSPDIQKVRLSYERSQKLLDAQNAALKSRFSLSINPFSYEHTRAFNSFFSTWNTTEIKSSTATFAIDQPILWTDGSISLRNQLSWRDAYSEYQDQRTKTYSNNLYLSYIQPIFTYNRTKLALDEVKLDKENALLNYRIQQLMLERAVTQKFYTTFESKMSLQIAEEDLKTREQSYQIIKNKVDAGLAATEELYQAELNLTGSKSQVHNKQVVLQNALDDLKRLIGVSLFDEIGVAAAITMDSVAVDMQKAIDYGLKNRFELRQRNISIELAKNNLTRSKATNEFKGNIALSYGIIGNDGRFGNVYKTPQENQNVNISFEIPLWDWGERNARIKAAEKSIESSRISFEDEQKAIIIAIRQSYRSLQNQIIQVELAKQDIKIAQLTYDINLERYKNGDLTSMDLNLVQNQLAEKKINLINAMITYKLNLLDLKIESLWDFEKNEPVFELSELEK
jgi:outer membrane protein TolC